MSDEPSSSAVAAAPASSLGEDAAGQHDNVSEEVVEPGDRRRSTKRMANRKREEFLDDLLNALDLLVYAELSAIYYMDCSFIRFIFRAFVQFLFLTSKPAMFPQPPRDRPVIGAILLSNVVCLLFHVWLSAPTGSDATRGYLHGGLAMDFVGQKGPTSKLHLFLLDLFVLVIQLLHASAADARKVSTPKPADSSNSSSAQDATTQDVDAEERGVRRSAEMEGIELQELTPPGTTNDAAQLDEHGAEAEETSEREALLFAATMPSSDAHIFDAFHSGQIVIVDLNIVRAMRNEFREVSLRNARNQSEQQQRVRRDQIIRAEFARHVSRLGLTRSILRREP